MEQRATRVRWGIVGVTTLASLLLYLDRICVSFASGSIQQEFDASPAAMSWFLSAFFWSYALFQVPAGWIGQRFGIRIALTLFILAWSLFTGLIGVVGSVATIIVLRLLCGLAQAGAYPCAGKAVRDWLPISQRGTGSSFVAFGGRVGGAIAPLLTGALMLWFAIAKAGPEFQPYEILDPAKVVQAITAPEQKAATDWFRKTRTKSGPDSDATRLAISLANANQTQLATFFNDPQSLPPFLVDLPFDEVPPDLRRRLQALDDSSTTIATSKETARRFWESALPQHLKKLEARGWRPTLILFGGLGIFVAAGFWWLFREDPARHPWCNAAEVALIHRDSPEISVSTAPPAESFPWMSLLTNISLWGNSIMQFLTNVGWIFLVTWLPRYLDEVHHVPVFQRSVMASVPLFAGMFGMLLGGPWTDRWTMWCGRKWGRSGPIAVSRFLAVSGYVLAVMVMWGWFGPRESMTTAWIAVAGMAMVAIATDLGVAATWAFAQDVGGKYTSAVLGWANMWGNLGAAIAPVVSGMVLGKTPALSDWTLLFFFCGGAFALSGVCACVMDATRPLTQFNAK